VVGNLFQESPEKFRAKKVVVPVTPGFAKFAEQSRARWDLFEWLKVKIKQASNIKPPTK